jgi:hypothetical protein
LTSRGLRRKSSDCSPTTVYNVKGRYLEEGLEQASHLNTFGKLMVLIYFKLKNLVVVSYWFHEQPRQAYDYNGGKIMS